MTMAIYYFALALSGADAQQSRNFPPPPVDLTARMARVQACTPLPRALPSPSSRSGSVADAQRVNEEAVLDGINRIADKLPQTRCEVRLK